MQTAMRPFEFVYGWIVSILWMPIEFVVYMAILLAIPTAAFLAPLGLGPLVVVYNLMVSGVGRVLTGLGLS